MKNLDGKIWAALVLIREPNGIIRLQVQASEPLDDVLVLTVDGIRKNFMAGIALAVSADTDGKIKH